MAQFAIRKPPMIFFPIQHISELIEILRADMVVLAHDQPPKPSQEALSSHSISHSLQSGRHKKSPDRGIGIRAQSCLLSSEAKLEVEASAEHSLPSIVAHTHA